MAEDDPVPIIVRLPKKTRPEEVSHSKDSERPSKKHKSGDHGHKKDKKKRDGKEKHAHGDKSRKDGDRVHKDGEKSHKLGERSHKAGEKSKKDKEHRKRSRDSEKGGEDEPPKKKKRSKEKKEGKLRASEMDAKPGSVADGQPRSNQEADGASNGRDADGSGQLEERKQTAGTENGGLLKTPAYKPNRSQRPTGELETRGRKTKTELIAMGRLQPDGSKWPDEKPG